MPKMPPEKKNLLDVHFDYQSAASAMNPNIASPSPRKARNSAILAGMQQLLPASAVAASPSAVNQAGSQSASPALGPGISART